MEDREVGELWRLASTHDTGWNANADFYVKKLIRKLVAERARRAAIATGNIEPFIKKALRDFGIDPETWGKP